MNKEQTPLTMDWWMHELYRCIKSFIHNPTEETQNRLIVLLGEYKSFHDARASQVILDEHEHVMDYR